MQFLSLQVLVEQFIGPQSVQIIVWKELFK